MAKLPISPLAGEMAGRPEGVLSLRLSSVAAKTLGTGRIKLDLGDPSYPLCSAGHLLRKGEIGKFIERHILFLLCAGSYATNLGMVLIRADDPPAEAGFSFLASVTSHRPAPAFPADAAFTLRPEFSL
ncbi:hypothetical protein [Mesorhizobium sp. M1163]|uniref:hypothetical protein n=1 Tax=Mesorhizobium sp. M1163 TaxID=2957065 RepID=UPI00333BA141